MKISVFSAVRGRAMTLSMSAALALQACAARPPAPLAPVGLSTLRGTWQGAYDCDGSLYPITLTVLDGTRGVEGIVQFTQPTGPYLASATVRGVYQVQTRTFHWRTLQWIARPAHIEEAAWNAGLLPDGSLAGMAHGCQGLRLVRAPLLTPQAFAALEADPWGVTRAAQDARRAQISAAAGAARPANLPRSSNPAPRHLDAMTSRLPPPPSDAPPSSRSSWGEVLLAVGTVALGIVALSAASRGGDSAPVSTGGSGRGTTRPWEDREQDPSPAQDEPEKTDWSLGCGWGDRSVKTC